MQRFILFLSLSLAGLAGLHAHRYDNGRPDAHAPISIMGDHLHKQGEWMLSYRFMRMEMNDLGQGDSSLSPNDVFAAGYTVTPTDMQMDMHMLGLMFAPNDWLTLMAMAHYQINTMDHQINPAAAPPFLAANGTHFTTQSQGFGDSRISALFSLAKGERSRLHAGLGLSLPTGSIDETDQLPSMMGRTEQRLPASMQLGSGTVDFVPSLTFVHQLERLSAGAQASAVLRLEDENDNGYRRGHRFELRTWSALALAPWLSVSGGLNYLAEEELAGTQAGVGTMGPSGRSVPTAFSENYGGQRFDGSIGANLLGTGGLAKGHRIAAELTLPIWQNVNGIQLQTDWIVTLGWQKAF